MIALVDKLVNYKDKQNPDDYRKGELFIWSMFAFIVVMVVSIPYIAYSGYGGESNMEALTANVTLCIIVVITIFLYTKFGYRVVIVNVINTLGHLSSYGTYDIGGGIYSPEPFFGLVMCAWIFLVGNRASGLFWFTVVILTSGFLYYAEVTGWKNFRADIDKLTPLYHFMNFFWTGAMLALI